MTHCRMWILEHNLTAFLQVPFKPSWKKVNLFFAIIETAYLKAKILLAYCTVWSLCHCDVAMLCLVSNWLNCCPKQFDCVHVAWVPAFLYQISPVVVVHHVHQIHWLLLCGMKPFQFLFRILVFWFTSGWSAMTTRNTFSSMLLSANRLFELDRSVLEFWELTRDWRTDRHMSNSSFPNQHWALCTVWSRKIQCDGCRESGANNWQGSANCQLHQKGYATPTFFDVLRIISSMNWWKKSKNYVNKLVIGWYTTSKCLAHKHTHAKLEEKLRRGVTNSNNLLTCSIAIIYPL